MRLFLTVCIITMLMRSAYADNRWQGYDDCIVKSFGWLTTDRAIQLVDETCISEIKAKEIEKAEQIVELLKQNRELNSQNIELKDRIQSLEDWIKRQPIVD